MKTYVTLALATIALIAVGVRSGAFDGHEPDSQAATNETTPKSSCCAETGDDDCQCDAAASCCADSMAAVTTGDGTTTPDCCAAGSCCSGAASRAAVIGAEAVTTVATLASEASATLPGKSSAARSGSEDVMADWPMWGGTHYRNMVSDATAINTEFNLQEGTHVAWTASLGSQTYGNAVVGGGKVIVGTNNGGGYRADKYPADEDKGVILCFDEETGEFQWQLTRDKLTVGRVCDWPLQGICSTATIEPAESEEDGYRLWVVTNRGEMMCLDLEGMADGNDGPFQDEVDTTDKDADILWSLDMINELGVFPHNLATSSPLVYEDHVYVLTSNGVDEAHLELPAPRAPSMICVNKNTGELVWEQNYPEDRVLHGQWSSPTLGMVNGQAQIYFPAGDGWLYALNPADGELIWKCDLNPKDTVWELGGAGTRNAIISTAVFYDNSVIIAVGQDPEHGEGVGHLWRIDATKTGDVSAELGEIGQPGKPNPDSAIIWHYGGTDEDGSVTGEEGSSIYRRTISTVSIHDGLVLAADLSGFLHCIDFETGKRNWEYDLFTAVWGSPMTADGKVFLGVEDGKLLCFELTAEEGKVLSEYETVNYSSVYSTPTVANGRMFITDRTRLYAVDLFPEE